MIVLIYYMIHPSNLTEYSNMDENDFMNVVMETRLISIFDINIDINVYKY